MKRREVKMHEGGEEEREGRWKGRRKGEQE